MKNLKKPWEVTYETVSSRKPIIRNFMKEKEARAFYKKLCRRPGVLSMNIVNVIDQAVEKIAGVLILNPSQKASKEQKQVVSEIQKKLIRKILTELIG